MQARVAAGYQFYRIVPLQVARYRERHNVLGTKSDSADAYMLADMVRTDTYALGTRTTASPAAGLLPGRLGGVRGFGATDTLLLLAKELGPV